MAGRIGPVAAAADRLAKEIRDLAPALKRFELERADGEARRLLDRGVAALEDFNRELRGTKEALNTLANRPLIGMLGGGAETALQGLGASIDRLSAVVEEVRRYVSG